MRVELEYDPKWQTWYVWARKHWWSPATIIASSSTREHAISKAEAKIAAGEPLFLTSEFIDIG